MKKLPSLGVSELVLLVPMVAITRHAGPFVLVQVLLTLAIVLFPAISETLPRYWVLGGL